MKDWTAEQAIAAQEAYVASGGSWFDRASPLLQWGAVLCIEALREQYEAGNSFALLRAVEHCAMRDLVMPEWVSRGYIDRLRCVTHYKVKTLDEAFGSMLPDRAKWTAYRQQHDKGVFAWDEVRRRHQQDGESIGPALFENVGKDLGIGASKVRDYYYDWQRTFTRKPPE